VKNQTTNRGSKSLFAIGRYERAVVMQFTALVYLSFLSV